MGERPADLGGPRQRALLARLVLAGGAVVSTDRLIDDLWAGDPPPKALGALQAHISYLRRAIEPARPPRAQATVLVSEAPGYALRLDPAAVDAWRFERLLAAGEPDDPARRYQRLGAALACWHGEPYAPFATAHWVLAEAARLHELRRVAVEGRAESALTLGRPDEAFALLHRHVADHPDRENAARLLALTQYRLGRQLDALTTLRDLRAYLDTEFGVVPSPAISALETAILTHAPELTHRVPAELADASPRPGVGAGAVPDRSDSPGEGARAPEAVERGAGAAVRGEDPAGRRSGSSGPRVDSSREPAMDGPRSERPAAESAIDGAVSGPSVAESAAVGSPSGRPVVVGSAPGRSVADPTVVGYTSERAALLAEAAAVVAHGRARVVWLEGEAGAGKSTQVEVLAAALSADGWTVARASCPEVDGAPAAWAWVHLLDGLGGDHPDQGRHRRGLDPAAPTSPGSSAPAAGTLPGPDQLGAVWFGGEPTDSGSRMGDSASDDVPGAREPAERVAGLSVMPGGLPSSDERARTTTGRDDRAHPSGAVADGTGAQAGPGALVWAADVGAQAGTGALVPAAEGVGAQAGPFAIAREVAQVCGRRLTGGPLLVVLEDVHRADSATLQILRQVVAWLTRRPLLVLVTARGSEADAGVRATAAALAGSTGRRLVLEGLDGAAVRAVAERAGLASIDDDTVEWLRARTAGNPLFVREVATLAAAVGDLRAVPEGVRAVLHRRIARLPAGAARALRLAAVWGDDIDFDTLLALTAEPEDTLIDLVDTVTVAGLVRIVDTDRITFAHALIRDAVYGDIPTLRRARLHWAALELLERRTGAARVDIEPVLDTVVLDAMAHHAIAGAGSSTATHALRYVLAAARRRTAGRAHQDAEPLWRAALELHARAGHDSPAATRPDRLAALATRCALINALAYGGNDEQARRLRTETLAIARALMPTDPERTHDRDAARTGDRPADAATSADTGIDTDPVVAVLTCWRAPTIWTSRDRGLPDSDISVDLASALDRTTAPDLRVRLLVTTVFAVEGFDNPRAFACSAEAVRTARELSDPELLCAALNARAFVALGPDLWSERGELADELLRVATTAGLPEYQAIAHFLRFLVASGAGRLVDARSEIAEALDCAEGGQLGPLLVVSTAHLAVLAVLRGDLATAEAIDADLSAKMIAAGNANGAELVLLARMMTGWARGDLAPGLDGYAQLYAAAPHAISYVYALALLDAGDTERASTVLAAGTEVLRDYYWGAMSAFEARVVARIGTVEAAERLYRDLLPRAGTIAGMDSGSVAFGPVDTVLAELADRLGDHAAASRHRAAAERVLADLATELDALDGTGAPLA